jgi:ribosomal protein S18 acetylase RimI-like enzyme
VAVVLRACVEGEAADVLTLWKTAEAEPSHTDDVDSIVKLIRFDEEALIVAVDDGQIVGSVICGWDGWRGAIYRLAVHPRYRRKGMAQRLVAEAEDRLRAKGAVRSAAIVVSTEVQATGFWRSSGWEEQKERLRFVTG